MARVELVVARYNESLAWLRKVPPEIERTIFNKNPQEPYPDSIQLPNLGREAHTYVQHIIERFDNLADITVFCQGHPFDHAFDFHTSLRQIAQNPTSINDFRWLGHIIDTDDARGHTLFRGWSKNADGRELDLGGFHKSLFGTVGPTHYTFVLGAQFAVTRQQIRTRPLDFWQRALELSLHFPDAAHCFERTWDKVMGVQGINREWLAGRTTVYLKPIKRLQAPTETSTED